MVYVWLGLAVMAIIVEFLTADMLSIWFAGGGLVAMIFAILNLDVYLQVLVFVAVSILLLFLFRKIVLNKLNAKKQNLNADSSIGKEFELLSPISFNQAGTIKVNDVIWNVVTENQLDELPEKTIVEVVGIRGNKYIVKEVKR